MHRSAVRRRILGIAFPVDNYILQTTTVKLLELEILPVCATIHLISCEDQQPSIELKIGVVFFPAAFFSRLITIACLTGRRSRRGVAIPGSRGSRCWSISLGKWSIASWSGLHSRARDRGGLAQAIRRPARRCCGFSSRPRPGSCSWRANDSRARHLVALLVNVPSSASWAPGQELSLLVRRLGGRLDGGESARGAARCGSRYTSRRRSGRCHCMPAFVDRPTCSSCARARG